MATKGEWSMQLISLLVSCEFYVTHNGSVFTLIISGNKYT